MIGKTAGCLYISLEGRRLRPVANSEDYMIPTVSSEAWLVFRGGYEYVFTNGETTDTLTVILSTTAINRFEKYNVTAEDLAKQAAEWALFIKRRSGTVDFRTATDVLADSPWQR